MDFRDGHVLVKAGEMIVVPRGVEHKTSAETEAKLMLIEPRGVLNTGHEGGERTAVNDVWIRSLSGDKTPLFRRKEGQGDYFSSSTMVVARPI